MRSSFTLRTRPGRPLVVRASMPPVLNISIQSRITRSLRQNCRATTRRTHEQGADHRKPDITAPIGRSLHRHPHLLQRGVLCIGLCLLMAQPPPYRIPCNSTNRFSEISYENRSTNPAENIGGHLRRRVSPEAHRTLRNFDVPDRGEIGFPRRLAPMGARASSWRLIPSGEIKKSGRSSPTAAEGLRRREPGDECRYQDGWHAAVLLSPPPCRPRHWHRRQG
jgi:hypothetical protein